MPMERRTVPFLFQKRMMSFRFYSEYYIFLGLEKIVKVSLFCQLTSLSFKSLIVYGLAIYHILN
jgi:hypothetical protein